MIRLLELRAEQGLTQRQVAKKLNVSQGTYNNWENGRTEPSIDCLINLSKIFNVSVDFLIGYQKDEENLEEKFCEQRKLYKNIQKLDEAELVSISYIVERLLKNSGKK